MNIIRLPTHNQAEWRLQWIIAIQSHQNTQIDRRNLYICRRHFAADCFKSRKKTELNSSAVPIIFDIIDVVEPVDDLPSEPAPPSDFDSNNNCCNENQNID